MMKSLKSARSRRFSNRPSTSVGSSGIPLAAIAAPSVVRQGMKRSGSAVVSPSEITRRAFGAEKAANLGLVGLKLVVGPCEGRMLIAGILQLAYAKWQHVPPFTMINCSGARALQT